MSLSFLLAAAMMMNGAPAHSGPLSQDTSKPESVPQNPTPAAEPNKGDAEKKEQPAKPPEETKKPDESKNADETSKPAESEKSTPAGKQPSGQPPAGKNPKVSSPGEPRKVVIRRGGALEPNARISPDLPPEEALKQRQHAEEMVLAAEDRLKLIAGRTLAAPQQEAITQIRNYIEKARSALRDGDTQRGHTLALKAYLLADDLVKH